MHSRKKSENKQTANKINLSTQYSLIKDFKYRPTASCFRIILYFAAIKGCDFFPLFSTIAIILLLKYKIVSNFSACDVNAFPGDGGANGLDADVPDPLAVDTSVPYMCTNPTYVLTPAGASNECNDQGMYINQVPACTPAGGKCCHFVA